MACRGIRQGDQYACAKCVLTWDVGEDSPCPDMQQPGNIAHSNPPYATMAPETQQALDVIAAAATERIKELDALKTDPVTFMQFAAHMGWELQPYQKQLVKMLDEQLAKRPLASFMSKRRGNT